MVKNSTNSTEALGNTKPKPKKQEPAKNRFCMTLNNYTEKEYRELIDYLSTDSTNKYIIAKEIGSIEKTEHLQIYVNFGKRKRFTEVKKINNRLHVEECKGSEEDNINYCIKDGNYIYHGLKIKKPLKILKEEQLYDWQKEILKIATNEAEDRHIYWFWEKEGNVGKTQFCKFLSYHHGAILIDGKKNDILYVASTYESDIYLFDFSRSIEGFVSYDAIEKVKNGYYMNSKYEGKMILRNSPHIIIFSNWKPEINSMSKDRWIVKKIKKEECKISNQINKIDNEIILDNRMIDLMDSDDDLIFD